MKLNRVKLHDLSFAQRSPTEAFESLIASEHHLDGGAKVFFASFSDCGVAFGVWECLWTDIATCSSGLG